MSQSLQLSTAAYGHAAVRPSLQSRRRVPIAVKTFRAGKTTVATSIRACAASPSPETETSPSSSAVAAAAVLNGGFVPTSGIEVDTVTEAELKENGFRSSRRTKLVCTIGPATSGFEELGALAEGGMNVARINMCHGDRDWHRRVIDRVRRLNEEKGYAVAIMMDTEGSEIHMGDLAGASSVKAEVWHRNNSSPFCGFEFCVEKKRRNWILYLFCANYRLKCRKCRVS